MTISDWTPLLLSFKLAFVTSLLLFLICIPLAYWLYRSRSRFTFLLEAIFSLPLILPPTVIGFYLLIFLSPNHFVGASLKEYLNIDLVFSFTGLVLGSLIYSFPFMLQPLLSGMRQLPTSYYEAALTMGKSELCILKKIILPNIRYAALSGLVLTFAHTIGEFGVVLMIGGKIPGETKVASIAIYDHVEALEYGAAHEYALILLLISFIILSISFYLNRSNARSPFI